MCTICVIDNILGISYFVRETHREEDALLVTEVIKNDGYRLDSFFDYFRKFQPKVILDFGGHIGCFAIKISRKVEDAKIYAYEPNTISCELYKKNMSINSIRNVFVFNKGISYNTAKNSVIMINSSTAVSLLVSEEDARKAESGDFTSCPYLVDMFANHFFGSKQSYSIVSQNISTVTLEEVLLENNIEQVDILKMDCEGAESDVLLNCSKESLLKIKCIMCEYHIEGGLKRIIESNEPKFEDFIFYDLNLKKLTEYSPGTVGSFIAIKKEYIELWK